MPESEHGLRAVPGGMTRDCIDPWTALEITPTGDVQPCCNRPSVGNLLEMSLAGILNGPAMIKLRKELLLGEPEGNCVDCRLRGPGTVEDLRQRVAALIEETKPPPEFQPEAYLAANPDVARAAIDPSQHFSAWGRLEGRRLFPDSET